MTEVLIYIYQLKIEIYVRIITKSDPQSVEEQQN